MQAHLHLIRQLVPGFILYALLALTLLLYWPGLHGPLLLDDYENLRSLADLSSGITTWRDVLTTSSSSKLGRPVAMLSFIANQLAGGGEVWPYKYTNLLIHLLCGLLVFWLAGRLLQETPLAPHRWMVSLWTVAFWLLTPLQVSTVLYVVQRMAQLSTLFVLAGLVAYVTGRQNLQDRPKLGTGLILSCIIVWLPLAVLSKENGVLLIPLMFIIEIFFFRLQGPPAGKRFFVVLYSLFLLLPAVAVIIKVTLDQGFILDGYKTRDFSLSERLLTESRILFTYLQTLLLPYGPGLGLYHDDYVKSTGILSPPTTLVSVLAWMAIVLVSIWSAKYKTQGLLGKASYFCFGLIFFLTAHILESTVFSLELYFEHRNYLPSFGIYFSVGVALFSIALRVQRKYFFLSLMALLPLAHAAASYPRVQIWTSWEQILFSTVQAHPQSARVHADLAIHYSNNHNPEQAFSHLDQAVKLKSQLKMGAALYRLIISCQNKLPITQAEYTTLDRSLSFSGMIPTKNALSILKDLLENKPCPDLNIVKLNEIFEGWLVQPQAHEYADDIWFIRITLGHILARGDQLPLAISQMDKAISLFPERLEAGLLKLQFQLALNDVSGARQTLVILKSHDKGIRIDLSQAISNYEIYLREGIAIPAAPHGKQ